MSGALAESLPIAAAIAISPIPITAVILMLLTDHARVNAVAVLAGWVLAIAAIAGLVALVGAEGTDAQEDPATGFVVAQFVLAAILLAAGIRHWRMRPKAGEPHDTPRWMERLLAITPSRAFPVGVGLIVLNLKDALLSVAGGAEIAQSGVSGGSAVATLAIFVAVSSATIAAPIAAEVALGHRADPILQRSRLRLERHGNTAVAVVLAVLAVLVALDAARSL